jgi:hypothetical protein
MQNRVRAIRVDFSLRREVFFVVVGTIVGALIMIIPKIILEVGMGLAYYLFLKDSTRSYRRSG